ncbi:1,4-alpha-glucan branching protein GlgB [Nannocystaceae bacterium ST9]
MLSPNEIDALIRAAHPDPFAVFGPHADERGVWLRAMMPGALGIEVIEGTEVVGELRSIHEQGLFEGHVEGRGFGWAYRLRVHYPLGHVEEVDDAYRFGSSLGELDRHLLGEGSHLRPWQVMGAQLLELEGVAGVRFCVWAPSASRVSVVGAFNHWDGRRHPMRLHPGLGVWEIFVPGVRAGEIYKYELRTREGHVLEPKADPYAFASQLRPDSASIVAPRPRPRALPSERHAANSVNAPIAIYEVHLGSWRRGPDNAFLSWAELAEQLPTYAAALGFTHVELLPCAEHPFDGSWGYQVTGMYAPTRRFGEPEGFAALVEACHAAGLGVILDWVPAHFPNDPHGLAGFDGTALYEYSDVREGLHRDWNTLVYNFARNEVRNFLIGNALYWLEAWGVDGLRVDAVASMLYRDYSRPQGEWIANVQGGRENLEAIALLRRVNEVVHAEVPGAVTIAEESTAWPKVSRPSAEGGLGFDFKWNMGWMHDSSAYMAEQPRHRRFHHRRMNFTMTYAYSENFVLALSHDEVVHGKGSLINKMTGEGGQRFANLRTYFAFQWTHPGKKLLFMGGEFAQVREWNHDRALDWHLLYEGLPEHRGIQALVRDLNRLYRELPALHELDADPRGFEWIEPDDDENSVLVYLRKDAAGGCVLVACNFSGERHEGYRVGVPLPGRWRLRLDTEAREYVGDRPTPIGFATRVAPPAPGSLVGEPIPAHGHAHSLSLTLAPLSALVLVPLPATSP